MHVFFQGDIKPSSINLALTNGNSTLYIPHSRSRSIIFILIQLSGTTNSDIRFSIWEEYRPLLSVGAISVKSC